MELKRAIRQLRSSEPRRSLVGRKNCGCQEKISKVGGRIDGRSVVIELAEMESIWDLLLVPSDHPDSFLRFLAALVSGGELCHQDFHF